MEVIVEWEPAELPLGSVKKVRGETRAELAKVLASALRERRWTIGIPRVSAWEPGLGEVALSPESVLGQWAALGSVSVSEEENAGAAEQILVWSRPPGSLDGFASWAWAAAEARCLERVAKASGKSLARRM